MIIRFKVSNFFSKVIILSLSLKLYCRAWLLRLKFQNSLSKVFILSLSFKSYCRAWLLRLNFDPTNWNTTVSCLFSYSRLQYIPVYHIFSYSTVCMIIYLPYRYGTLNYYCIVPYQTLRVTIMYKHCSSIQSYSHKINFLNYYNTKRKQKRNDKMTKWQWRCRYY